MGKKEPTNLELALIEQARTLYYEFRTVAYIHKQTGLKETTLKKLIYGPRGHFNPSTDSWFYERSLTNSEEFLELSARNRFLAHHFTAKALHETYEGMKAMDKRMVRRKVKQPDGTEKWIEERRYLTPQEMKYINDTVSTLDKLMRLSEGLPTDIIDMRNGEIEPGPVTIPGGPAGNIVLDMDRVARALKLDPAMSKLLQGAVHGHDGTGSGHEGPPTDGQSGAPREGAVERNNDQTPKTEANVGASESADGTLHDSGLDKRSEQPGGVPEVPRDTIIAGTADTDKGHVVVVASEVIEPGPEVSAPGGHARTVSKGVERDGHSAPGEGRRNKRARKNSEGGGTEVSGVGVIELHHEERADEPLSSEGIDNEDRGDGASPASDEEPGDWSEPSAGSDPFADEYS